MHSSSGADVDFGESNSKCFQQVDVLLKVAIQPVYSSKPIEAVQQQLNNMLFKYNESLEGIPLSFSDLGFPTGREYARILADQFWLHVDVNTKVVLFKPTPGQKVTGRVQKVSQNHISILILALFNASISEEEMRKGYSFDHASNSWQSAAGDLKDGDSVELVIHSYQHASGVIHIEGALPVPV